MRFYVGTLHTIENEFEDCVAAIRRQTHPDFEHFVFSGLGNEESHAALYGDFASKRDRFDLMVKIDADMVLRSDELLANIAERFRDPKLKMLSIAVHDWYTDRLISGLNAYRNDVVWRGDAGKLFVDNVKVETAARKWDDDLAPAADHCPDPSPFQAFHFGLHKAMKVIQPQTRDSDRLHWRMREHWDNLVQTERHLERNGDRRLALVGLAAEFVFSGCFVPEHVSYDHPEPKRSFARYAEMGTDEIRKETRRLRLRNGGWLPESVRCAWLWYRFRRKHASMHAVRMLLLDALGGRSPDKVSQ